MIEVTVIRGDGTPFQFQFENDALQAFLTKEAAEGVICKVVSLTALGVPIARPKIAGPGAPRTPRPTEAPAMGPAQKPTLPERK